MALRPIPRKRRRDKNMWKTYVISFIAASLYPLAKMFLVFIAVAVITVIACLLGGNFSGIWRFIGGEALFLLLMWLILCLFVLIPTMIAEKSSGKKKNHPADDGERVDKIDRNISRKRIRKQKTLARDAAKRKQQKK